MPDFRQISLKWRVTAKLLIFTSKYGDKLHPNWKYPGPAIFAA